MVDHKNEKQLTDEARAYNAPLHFGTAFDALTPRKVSVKTVMQRMNEKDPYNELADYDAEDLKIYRDIAIAAIRACGCEPEDGEG